MLMGRHRQDKDKSGNIITVPFVYLGHHAQAMIISLWLNGKNTADIAKALGAREHEIANRLPSLLAQRRQMRGGR